MGNEGKTGSGYNLCLDVAAVAHQVEELFLELMIVSEEEMVAC